MGISKSRFACLIVAIVLMTTTASAEDFAEEMLSLHNAARADVGVEAMTWDDTVADYAQKYAMERTRDCNLIHSGGEYGENIAAGTGEFSGSDAAGLWVGEKGNYDYGSNCCARDKVCGHYTQVVWRNSVYLGCARVPCDVGCLYSYFVICNYSPPGNYIGDKPY